MSRYDQCDETCTTDCGHCKGQGWPQQWPDKVRQAAAAALSCSTGLSDEHAAAWLDEADAVLAALAPHVVLRDPLLRLARAWEGYTDEMPHFRFGRCASELRGVVGGRVTALDGATTLGDPAAFSADAGEFAARWNATTKEDREQWVHGMAALCVAATRCFESHHEEELHRLKEQAMHPVAQLDEHRMTAGFHGVHPGSTCSLDEAAAIHDAHIDEGDERA